MKYILPFTLAILLSFMAKADPKVVYVSIDVSGSMYGNKYNLANYTVQMITALMEDDDELYLSICSDFKPISMGSKRQAEIDALQIPIQSRKIVYRKTEIGDINEFIRIFKNTPSKEQWYFIVGDGYWNIGETCEQFRKLILENPIRVCFLETMEDISEHGDFGMCLDDLNFVEQYRTSSNPQTIIESCLQVATELFGVSNQSISIQKKGSQSYTVVSQIPVRKFYIIYQDETETSNLPSLQAVKQAGQNLTIARQSVVSTEKYRKHYEELLSGKVTVLSPKNLILAGQPVEFVFDKAIDISKLQIYPMVDVKLAREALLTDEGIPQTTGNETVICIENKSFKVVYELSDAEGNALPNEVLEKTAVVVKTDSGEYSAALLNGVFECSIPMGDKQELYYSVSAKCDGYFNHSSDKKKVIRSEDCVRPSKGELDYTGDVHISELVKGTQIGVQIIDVNNPSKILNPNDHELKVKQDYWYLFKNIQVVDVTDESFHIRFESRDIWCDCFMPDTLTITVYSTDKTGEYLPVEQKIKVPVSKSGTTWYARCYKVILTATILFFGILYLRLLVNKKRFKKGASIRYQYFGVGGVKSRENTDDLRAKGLLAWIYRWWIPFGGERSSKVFNKANNKLFTFMAMKSNRRIEIPKTQFNPKEMSSIDFDRDQFESRHTKTFEMSDNTMIKITLPGGTGHFQLCYDRGTGIKDDVPAFNAFIRFLMVIAILVEIMFIYFLLTSII